MRGHGPLALEAILPMIGDGARALVARALAVRASGSTPDAIDDMAVLFQRCYVAHPCVHTVLMSGADELLALDLPCAVVTNKPRIVTLLVLEALGLTRRVRAVWAGGDGPMKPAPDGLQVVARAMNRSITDAWMIGDGPQDVLAGRAAGCYTVAVPGIAERERVLAAEPDKVVDSLVEVARLALAFTPELT
jgi:phosphoglycolate phosphatase